LTGEVAEAAEGIIRKTRKELDIEIITNFLEGRIKNKKSKSFYIAMTNVQLRSSALGLSAGLVLKYWLW